MQSTNECINISASEALNTIYRSVIQSNPSIADALIDAIVPWDQVWDMAESEISHLWCLDFVTRHPETITDERMMRWRLDYYARIAYNQTALKGLSEISEACVKAGIQIIALKGASFLLWLYQDPGIRTLYDLDLLVDEDQALDAVAVLEKIGYQLDHAHTFITSTEVLFHISRIEGGHLPPFYRYDQFPVELHIDILRGRGNWENAREDIRTDVAITHYGEVGIASLSPEHSLIHASVHYAKHLSLNQQQPRWLLDIALMLNRPGLLDLEKVGKTADRWEVTDDLYVTIEAVNDTFGLCIPLPDRKPVNRVLRRVPSAIEKIRCLPTTELKLIYLRDNIFPSPEYMRQTFQVKESRLSLYWAYLRLYIQRIKSVLGFRDRV